MVLGRQGTCLPQLWSSLMSFSNHCISYNLGCCKVKCPQDSNSCRVLLLPAWLTRVLRWLDCYREFFLYSAAVLICFISCFLPTGTSAWHLMSPACLGRVGWRNKLRELMMEWVGVVTLGRGEERR
jgi:hypothetical protein